MQTINTLIEKRSTLYIVYRKCTANCKVELRDYRDSVMSSYIIENLHFSRAHVRLYLYVDLRIHARFNVRSFIISCWNQCGPFGPCGCAREQDCELAVVSICKQGSVQAKWKCIASIINQDLHFHQQSPFSSKVNVCSPKNVGSESMHITLTSNHFSDCPVL